MVARAFDRFFNAGECLAVTKHFDWASATAREKIDGSLLLVYFWRGDWRVQTRGSFASGKITDECPYTWRELAEKAIPKDFWWRADHRLTYVMELCTPYNRVVKQHVDYSAWLLSLFCRDADHIELVDSLIEHEAIRLGLPCPKLINILKKYRFFCNILKNMV